MKYTKTWLLEAAANLQETDYLLFWGHRPSKDGSITKSCFSQWWQSAFSADGKIYKTAEHWMMEKKALLFGSDLLAEKILATEDPEAAKKLGRQIRDFNETTWQNNRDQIVIEGNYHKFDQHDQLKSFLLSTAHSVIVEASPVDSIWGAGISADHPDIYHPGKWPGLNLLGFALMEVRDMLRNTKS